MAFIAKLFPMDLELTEIDTTTILGDEVKTICLFLVAET